MTDLQTAARQALEAMFALRALVRDDALACSYQTLGQYRTALLQAIDRAALAGPVEPVPQPGVWMHPWPPVRAQQAEPKGGGRLPLPLQAEPDLSLCPQCNGPADNGHDRSIPPSPYLCTKCMAEPVREPVAWLVMDESGYVQHAASWRDAAHEHINDAINEHDLVCARTWRVVPVYTAPPQRKPLTGTRVADAIRARGNK